MLSIPSLTPEGKGKNQASDGTNYTITHQGKMARKWPFTYEIPSILWQAHLLLLYSPFSDLCRYL